MNVFELRNQLVYDYASYTRSFIKIADPRINEKVASGLEEGAFWPKPLLQLNPAFESGGTIDDLVSNGTLRKECARIFRIDKSDQDFTGQQLHLHSHQTEAILKAKHNKSYVLTSGTGSGKSLAYIVPIVDRVLRSGSGRGIQAIVVYPMNALANSQHEELTKFLVKGYEEGQSPVRFARYTGQERGEEREKLRANPPDILLTNYIMLELMLTRSEDRQLVKASQNLRFLVLDELHTYRGRQGADVALLIRRCRLAFDSPDMICVGTSATMASRESLIKQKEKVANVSQTLFGTDIAADQVIVETLQRATPELDYKKPEIISSLKTAIQKNQAPPKSYEEFRKDPVSSWIESFLGVKSESGTGSLVRQQPRPLEGKDSASQELAKLTATDPDKCAEVLQRFLLTGSTLRETEHSRFPVFAFRLHQFFTRGDTVWTTIEKESSRYIGLSKLAAKPQELDKRLFPLAFCRECGTAYYQVSIVQDGQGRKLIPRENQRENQRGGENGYLYISDSAPWPRTYGDELLERLPSFMRVPGKKRIRADCRKDVPESVFVDHSGKVTSEGDGIPSALISRNFLFCLNPKCRITYTKTQRSDKTKLGTLGVDNRSTATTILAARSLIELHGDGSTLNSDARKMLSFTDSRQDASLQSGHFNDFTQVVLLRAALYKASQAKGEAGLSHKDVARSVFDVLDLRFKEYAADRHVEGPARQATDGALRRVIDYYLYRDLERGWRITAPNLEGCGLLRFEYNGLVGEDSLMSDRMLWDEGIKIPSGSGKEECVEVPAPLRICSAVVRDKLIRTLLDNVLRNSLAIKVDSLNPSKQQDLVEQTRLRLREGTFWYFEDHRELSKSVVAYPCEKRSKNYNEDRNVFVSRSGAYGRFVRRELKGSNGEQLGYNEVNPVICFLFQALRKYGIVEQVRKADVPGYQINADALRWVTDSGQCRPIDPTRHIEAGQGPSNVNEYFRDCYREGFINLKRGLEAREHTAQVLPEVRKEREDSFREGELPLLFCSPTMELGIDIAQLNLVNLRNVPPTPANYAQRSGRAGRSGQPALVYTYCAGRSPHDQFYFRHPDQMVAGSVHPRKVDLLNRDLLRSHVHAIWVEVVKPDLGKTLTSVIDIDRKSRNMELPINESIKQKLTNPAYRAEALLKSDQLVDSIGDSLNKAAWFHDDWTKETLNQIERSFDQSCDRWRTLYRSAVQQRELHHQIIGDTSRPEADRKRSRRLRSQAENQIRILTEASGVYEGDFYTYRYFAVEGFLPGYNFPRLPLSAYVPPRQNRRDEFISRPRFLAISEFGPRALIYHEGAHYRVDKANLDFGAETADQNSPATEEMKRCTNCGYAHIEQGNNLAEKCDRCGEGLDDKSVVRPLVRMQNVSLRLARRITCDEEERQRFGYRLVSSYRFPNVGGKLDRLDATVSVDGAAVMKLSYGDATELYRLNLGWARQDQPRGFMLDLENGYWARNSADDSDQADATTKSRRERVVPFVTDTKNALVMQYEPFKGSEPKMATLQAAFKAAILKRFQLEPRELSCESLPSRQKRNEILFYEAAEGGAGVLRQLVENPAVIPELASVALDICHFDPDTLEDTKRDGCGKACYKCLLDYGNQPDHTLLDRNVIREALHSLIVSECKPSGGIGSREERMVELHKRCDSRLEIRWLAQLENFRLHPPSDAQYLIEACTTRPDFFYRGSNVAIYVDGPPHDEPKQKKDDEKINRRLLECGYAVIRFHHKSDWRNIFSKHPDIFGKLDR